MGCGCDDCKKKHRVKRRVPAMAASILYLLGQKMKKPKSKPSFMKAKRKVQRKKKGGKYMKGRKMTKVPRRRVKVLGKRKKT